MSGCFDPRLGPSDQRRRVDRSAVNTASSEIGCQCETAKAVARICHPMPILTAMTDEYRELDAQWRRVFRQPLPMLGAPDVARAILAQHTSRKTAP